MMNSRNKSIKKYDVILTCNYSPWSSYCGGGQKSTHMVACALSQLGYAVCVVYSKSPFEQITVPSVPYHIEWATFYAIKPGISSVFRYLNGISFFNVIDRISTRDTVLHANGDEGSLLGRIGNKRKIIYTNRYPNLDSFLFNKDWKRFSAWATVWCREPRFAAMALAIRDADAVTCTSEHSMLQIKRCFNLPSDRIHLVYNGLDPSFFSGTIPDFRRQRGVLFYGRLTKAKGVDVLLSAFARLPDKVKQKHPLTIIGQGPLEKKLRKDAVGLPVLFRNWLSGDALVSEIQHASLVVLPSLEESFGNTMLETLSLGQRLLTTNCGSLQEVLGGYGYRIDRVNPELLSALMIQILNMRVNSALQRRQQQFVRQRYSWQATAQQFSNLYNRS